MNKKANKIHDKLVDKLNEVIRECNVKEVRVKSLENIINRYDEMIFEMRYFGLLTVKEYFDLYRQSKSCRNDIN